jgi:hypothetical protein
MRPTGWRGPRRGQLRRVIAPRLAQHRQLQLVKDGFAVSFLAPLLAALAFETGKGGADPRGGMSENGEDLRKEFEQASTADLVSILRNRDEQEWRPEVFAVVALVLKARGVSPEDVAAMGPEGEDVVVRSLGRWGGGRTTTAGSDGAQVVLVGLRSKPPSSAARRPSDSGRAE